MNGERQIVALRGYSGMAEGRGRRPGLMGMGTLGRLICLLRVVVAIIIKGFV